MNVSRLMAAATAAMIIGAATVSATPHAMAVGDCSTPPAPGVDWSYCDLSGVNLAGANLAGASLVATDLWFADLTDATLTGADLSSTDLSDAFVACEHGGVLGTGITGTPVVLPTGWTLAGGTLAAPTATCPPPVPDWVQAYGRAGADSPCRDGWEASWSQWPNDGTGGFVCQRAVPSLGPGSGSGSGAGGALSVRTRVRAFATAGAPFTAVQTPSGALLVSVSFLPVALGSTEQPAGIEVFRPTATTYVSTCLTRLPSSLPLTDNAAQVMGLRLFADGAYVGAAIEDNGLAIYDVADLEDCRPQDPTIVPQVFASDEAPSGTVDLTVTADSGLAFVANEYGSSSDSANEGDVGVTAIDLVGAGATQLLRQIGTPGNTLAGVTLSPDGRRLYVSTEVSAGDTDIPGADNPILGGPPRCLQTGSIPQLYGLISVIDVEKAVTGVDHPIVRNIASGCSPTRMDITADGETLFVGARGDNRLLAFSTAALEGPDPASALLGYASTGPPGSDGSAPVGLQLFQHDRLLLMANSNRFVTPAQGNAEIFDVTDPSSPRLVTTIATGLFPRNVTVAADGTTLFLTNYDSNQVQVIRTLVR